MLKNRLLSSHTPGAEAAGISALRKTAQSVSEKRQNSAVVNTTAPTAGTGRQKSWAAAAVAATLGVVVCETAVLFRQRDELAAFPEQSGRLHATLRNLRREQDAATSRLQETRDDLHRLARVNLHTDSATEAAIEAWLARVSRLKQLAAGRADLNIPELEVLTDRDWFTAAKEGKFDTEEQIRETFRKLHDSARNSLARLLHTALSRYAVAHDGQLPANPAQLEPFMERRVSPAILARFEMLQHGEMSAVPKDEPIVAERASSGQTIDSRVLITPQEHSVEDLNSVSDRELRRALRAFVEANHGKFPSEPAQLLSYFKTPPRPAALKSLLEKPKGDFTTAELRKLLPPD